MKHPLGEEIPFNCKTLRVVSNGEWSSFMCYGFYTTIDFSTVVRKTEASLMIVVELQDMSFNRASFTSIITSHKPFMHVTWGGSYL